MDRLLWVSLLLIHLPWTDGIPRKVECLSQQDRVIWKKTGHMADLACRVHNECGKKGFHYEWFAFKEHGIFRLNLSSDKYSMTGPSLHIKSLHVNDSGIYYCAAAKPGGSEPSAQYVGPGQTLVVRDKTAIMVRHILLWLSFVLLAIYSMAVLTLILLKKNCCKKGVDTEKTKINKESSRKKMQFRDVLQEMYRKRDIEKSKPTAVNNELDNDTIYQNV